MTTRFRKRDTRCHFVCEISVGHHKGMKLKLFFKRNKSICSTFSIYFLKKIFQKFFIFVFLYRIDEEPVPERRIF